MVKNKIVYQTKALRQLRKIPIQHEIRSRIKVLEEMPNCIHVKALVNHVYQYRLRVGAYRVFFNFDGIISIISIEEVKKRDDRTY